MIFQQHTWAVVKEVPIFVCFHDRGAPKGVNTRVFPNLMIIDEYWNFLLCKQLSFCFFALFPFCKKEIFP
jgi:hypothetical protein